MLRICLLLSVFAVLAQPVAAATIPPESPLFDEYSAVSMSGGASQGDDVVGNRLGLLELGGPETIEGLTSSVFAASTNAAELGAYAGPDVQFLAEVVNELTNISSDAWLGGRTPGPLSGFIPEAVWGVWEGTRDIAFRRFEPIGTIQAAGVSYTASVAGRLLLTAFASLPVTVWLLLAAFAVLPMPRLLRRRVISEICPG